MDKRYARLKRKMLLLVVAGTLAALAVGMLLLHTVVDGVLQDPFARAFLWVAQNLFGQDEAAALELYQQTVRNQKPGLLALGTIVLMLVAFYLALGRFTPGWTRSARRCARWSARAGSQWYCPRSWLRWRRT